MKDDMDQLARAQQLKAGLPDRFHRVEALEQQPPYNALIHWLAD